MKKKFMTGETANWTMMSANNLKLAKKALDASGISKVWERHGCRVNIVGSMRMGLMGKHPDIDLHVYSKGITTEKSFSIMAEIAKNPAVEEIKCINGLHTSEHCIAWHVMYRDEDRQLWQIDVIHIEDGSEYDGYFERMADRIVETATDEQHEAILRLKFSTPDDTSIHGVEYYEAVIADGVRSMAELTDWVKNHRQKAPYYWIP
ncbi:MAG: phosphoglycerate mutase family protein [Duncaniella sp.]|nr:phosphoglycerate mutase family protein [Duncaniella sp.]MDE7146203.1 phosphoglycerate mutase family protein [Duncaniella sp.]